MFDAKLALAFVLGALGGAASERMSLQGAEVPLSSTNVPAAKPADSADACDACLNAASSGNIVGAASAARTCADGTKKAMCTKKVKSAAPGAAKAAALNGQCAAARAIVAAAESIGAGSSALKSAVKNCK